MSDVIYPTRPAKCHDCPQRGRAWCLDGEGYPECDREGDFDEDETSSKEDDSENTTED